MKTGILSVWLTDHCRTIFFPQGSYRREHPGLTEKTATSSSPEESRDKKISSQQQHPPSNKCVTALAGSMGNNSASVGLGKQLHESHKTTRVEHQRQDSSSRCKTKGHTSSPRTATLASPSLPRSSSLPSPSAQQPSGHTAPAGSFSVLVRRSHPV